MDFNTLHFSAQQNWPTPQDKIIFLDRDGTISFENSIEKADRDLKVIPGAKEALIKLKDKGFYLVLITNQPRVGRGYLSEERLREIHEKLQEDLGIKFDCVLYCPHSEDGVGEYELDCGWKKPKPGMLKFFLNKFGLNPANYFFIGDSEKDIMAGTLAGLKTILLSSIITEDLKTDYTTHSLKEAVSFVLNS